MNDQNEESGIYYYHADHLGSSSVVTDKNGKFHEHLEYFPYGETWINDRANNEDLPYKFTGKELDPETGLYFYGARYYDSKLSRWISADPPLATGEYLPNGNKKHDANLPGMGGVFNSINLDAYQYCGQNPVKFVDPDGRFQDKSTYVTQKRPNIKISDNGTTETWAKAEDVFLVTGGVVEKGDTLWSIAKNELIRSGQEATSENINNYVKILKKINKLQSNTIRPGDKLVTGVYYSHTNITGTFKEGIEPGGMLIFNCTLLPMIGGKAVYSAFQLTMQTAGKNAAVALPIMGTNAIALYNQGLNLMLQNPVVATEFFGGLIDKNPPCTPAATAGSVMAIIIEKAYGELYE